MSHCVILKNIIWLERSIRCLPAIGIVTTKRESYPAKEVAIDNIKPYDTLNSFN